MFDASALPSFNGGTDFVAEGHLQGGEEKAYRRFCAFLRWPETNGAPVCPRRGYIEFHDLRARRRFKCAACHHQFSATSGAIFASRRPSYVDLLGAICPFVNGSKDMSAVQLSRNLDVQYKPAFVPIHKFREAIALTGRPYFN